MRSIRFFVACAVLVGTAFSYSHSRATEDQEVNGYNFQFRVSTDLMSDETSCTLLYAGEPFRSAIIYFGIYKDKVIVWPGRNGDFYPQQSGLLRIGKNKPIKLFYNSSGGGFLMPDQKESSSIIQQLFLEGKYAIRYVDCRVERPGILADIFNSFRKYTVRLRSGAIGTSLPTSPKSQMSRLNGIR